MYTNKFRRTSEYLLQLTITLQPVTDASEVHLRRDDCIKHDSNPQGDLRGR